MTKKQQSTKTPADFYNNASKVEIDEKKAKIWFEGKEGLSPGEAECMPFFDTMDKVFDFIIREDGDTDGSGTYSTLKSMSNYDIKEILDLGFKTIMEFEVFTWERIIVTPYGYLAEV